jgi:hypothetical protein
MRKPREEQGGKMNLVMRERDKKGGERSRFVLSIVSTV